MPPKSSRAMLALLILAVGINLRPLLAAIGPLLDAIQAQTGLSDSAASLLTSLPVLLMGICLLCTRQVKALFGSRAGVAVGMLAIGLACLGRWQWPEATALIAASIVGGAGIALVQALMPSVIHERAGRHVAGMMGLYSTAIMGSAAITSFAAPRIASDFGWPAATGIWGVPAIVGLVLWYGLAAPSGGAAAAATARPIWRDRRSWLLLAFFGLATGGYTLVLAWLPPYYTGLEWSAAGAGTLLTAVTVAEVVAGLGVSFAVGRFTDRRPMILTAIAALFAAMLCLAIAPLSLAWMAALLGGLGIGALFPLGLIVAMDHGGDAAEAGVLVGFVQGGGYLLAALLPVVAGAVRQHLSSLSIAWWLMAGLCLILAAIAIRLRPGDRLA